MLKNTTWKVLAFALGALIGASFITAPASALNILLTNDDGYGAPGITAVQAALEGAGHTVYVVAPAEQNSGNGTSINTDANSLVDLDEMVAGKEWAMHGTPTDAVNVAFGVALAGLDIDLIVSGANKGDNVGIIANHSGTVSAAMRGVRLGYPAIAISVATDLKNLYTGYKILSDEDPTNDPYADHYFAAAEANELGAMDDAGQLVVDIIAALEASSTQWWTHGTLLPEGIGINVNIPAKETADWSGVLFTKSDNGSIIDLTFVDIGYPGKVLVTANIDDMLIGVLFGQVPADVLNLKSEGEANVGGYATISPMDGNWSSDGSFFKGRSVRHRLKSVLSAE